MFKKIVALLLGLQLLTFPAGATTTYKICGLPDAGTVADSDHFELSRACGGSYNATGAELATYFLSKAPGTNGQFITNQNGQFAALSPAAADTLLGLAPVATSGAYGSLSGLPTIPSAQVNSDWNAASGLAQILNKPPLGSLAAFSSINNTNWSGTPLSLANGGTGATTQGAAQTALGLVPGTNVQGYSAELSASAALSNTGYVKRTGTATWATAPTIPNTDVTGLGTASTFAATAFLQPSNNLSDITAPTTALTNLGFSTLGKSLAALPALTANGLVVGNGTGAPTTVTGTAPGQVPTWNGTAYVNAVPGNVTGPTTSTDRTLPRLSGTAGNTLLPSNIAVTDNDEISGFRSLVVTDTTTARTLASGDRGTTIVFTNSSPITVTLPVGAFSGFNVEIVQGGTGQITFTPASGATLTNAHAQTKTYGQGASVRLLVTGNVGGSAAAFNLAGDTGS